MILPTSTLINALSAVRIVATSLDSFVFLNTYQTLYLAKNNFSLYTLSRHFCNSLGVFVIPYLENFAQSYFAGIVWCVARVVKRENWGPTGQQICFTASGLVE